MHSSDEMYGADRIVLDVVEALTSWDVTVWLPAEARSSARTLSDVLAERGVRVEHRELPIIRRSILTPSGVFGLLRRTAALSIELRRTKPAVVWCATSACLMAAPAARLAGLHRVVVHVQEMWVGLHGRGLRLLASWTTDRIAISRAVADSAALRGIVVVPNSVPRPSGDEVAATASATDDALTFVVASRWNPWKGHATLIRAWSIAGEPGRLLVLGGQPALGAGVDVPALVRAEGVEATVDVVGEVDEIGPYLRAADVLVLPSDEPEPFGLVVLEALARGVPVVASDAGGPLEVLTDAVDGWFFTRRDASDLARVLQSVDRQGVVAAGAAAVRTYESNFAPEQYARRISDVLGR